MKNFFKFFRVLPDRRISQPAVASTIGLIGLTLSVEKARKLRSKEADMSKEMEKELFRTLDQKEMGKRIRSRREALGFSREKLAELLDVSPQFVADIEYGNKGISIKRFYLLSQVLDVTADYLLAGNIYSNEVDRESMLVCEEIMTLLQRCDTKQLKGIREIAEIYADGVRSK